MAHLYKASMWQGGSGRWYCGDIEDLGNYSGRWWVPCRILQLSPQAYINLLINDFNLSNIKYDYDMNVLVFSWDKESDCRKYKNWINKKARDANYIFT